MDKQGAPRQWNTQKVIDLEHRVLNLEILMRDLLLTFQPDVKLKFVQRPSPKKGGKK